MHLTVVAATLIGAISVNAVPATPGCKTFPGDKTWPGKADWDAFNQTVNGRLVATVPLGTPCHGSSFNNATCESLKSQWQTEQIQYVIRAVCTFYQYSTTLTFCLATIRLRP
jgi:hypothetical protein